MKHGVFSVKDVKAELFSQPILSVNVSTISRTLGDVVNGSSDHQYARHPEDFVLYQLGFFEDGQGRFDLAEAPHSICVLSDLKNGAV